MGEVLMRISSIRFVAVAAVAAFALAACSSSSKPAASPSTNPTTTTVGSSTSAPASGPVTISLVTHGKFGKIMVDSKGMTLYEDEKDKPGPRAPALVSPLGPP